MSMNLEWGTNEVRSIALTELLERYLTGRNNDPFKNPLDKRDENNTNQAFQLLAKCHPLADSSQIDPDALEKYKEFLVQTVNRKGQLYSRSQCNRFLKFVKTVFIWASHQKPAFVTEARAFALSKVQELKPSPKIREDVPREPAKEEDLKAILPFLRKEREVVADMFDLQIITAMRSGEVCGIKPCEIDRNYKPDLWLYAPKEHKTAGRGKKRPIIFGKESQEIIKKYMKEDEPHRHVFLNMLGNPFTTWVYDAIIRETIEKYNLPKVVPYQARHKTLTEIEDQYGIEYARAYAGHSDAKMTRKYVHGDVEKIRKIAEDRNRALSEPEPPSPPPIPGEQSRPRLRIFIGDAS